MPQPIDDQVSLLRAMVEYPYIWELDRRDVAAIQMAVRVLSVLQVTDVGEITPPDGVSWLECLAAAGEAMELANGKI